MVKLENVTKRFKSKTVVDNISLTVNRGELFRLLGPNGAGKTTTISMIVGALTPENGVIKINGLGADERQAVKRLLGIVPQTLAVYETLTAEENLNFFGRIYGLNGKDLKDRIEHVVEIVNLTERGNEKG